MKNTAINPQVESYTLKAAKLRSSKVKNVSLMKDDGGCSDQVGNIFVPDEETASGRTIRLHEPGHVDFTPRRNSPADMMDQALEDARLHRHCLGPATKKLYVEGIVAPRRDEMAIALRDLRKVIKSNAPIRPIDSLVTLRAMGILDGEYPETISQACSKLGPKFQAQAEQTITNLKASKGKHASEQWQAARKQLAQYFREDFDGPKPPQPPQPPQNKPEQEQEQEQKNGSGESEEQEPVERSDSDGNEKQDEPDDESQDGDSEDGEQDGNSGEQDGNSGEQDDKDGEQESKSQGKGEQEQDGEPDGERDEDGTPAMQDGKMAQAVEVVKPKPAKPRNPDEYAGDLKPDFDGETYAQMSRQWPTTTYIRQLQLGVNSVEIKQGEKAARMVRAGATIVGRRLVAGVTTPNARIFSKTNAQGGGGSIIIDASGSMSLTDAMLQNFLAKAPMLTLAFYNSAGSRDDLYGNIYVYAANGRRAKTLNLNALRRGCISDKAPEFRAKYGYNNLIDYQAIAWLLKQPAPRYIVTDCGFTGPWSQAAAKLLIAARNRMLLKTVVSLEEMRAVLDNKPLKDETARLQARIYFKNAASGAYVRAF